MKISLVLASKNEEKNIKTFFDAISKQTRKPDEIILVDSSDDNTAKLAKPFVDRLIKVEGHKRRDTAGYQRNIGVKESKGQIIVFTDLDAIPYPDWLEKIVSSFKNPEVKVLQGVVYFRSYDGKEDKGLFSTGLKSRGNYLNHCNAAFRREVLEENPLAEDIRWDDVELGYRLTKKKGYIIYGTKEAKVYHFHVDPKHRDLWHCAIESGIGWVRILKRHFGIYWIARIWYNIFAMIFAHGIKSFFYYAFAFFYAIYLETFRKSKD